MSEETVEALLTKLRSGTGVPRWSEVRLLRRAIDRYAPSTLNELYMAVRATDDGGGVDLVGHLESHADQGPDRSLDEFLGTR